MSYIHTAGEQFPSCHIEVLIFPDFSHFTVNILRLQCALGT